MRIHPIKSKKDHRLALKRIETLLDARPNTPEGDELEILSVLVENYEGKHYPILPPDPVEAIKFRMEQMGMKKTDLAPYVGGRNRATEVLQKKRNLTLTMLRSLHRALHIPAESLLGVRA